MDKDSLQSSTYWLLIQASMPAKHNFARIAEEYGLSWGQLYTLCSLNPERPVPMNAISGQLSCDASNVTGIVDRLSAHGLAKRQDDQHDRRIKLIALTKKGVRIRRSVIRDLQRHEPVGFEQLSANERRTLQKLLTKILAN